ncbi:prohead protease [Halogranum tailed virus 1]|uniref:Prohead protease n=1 Tax=Halogranum tailed virus 1 TaxID=1273749 RepID=R4TGH1_9CAUD|nr:prohead protease [Halogranum tailed virus 1]AGM11341.1 prohead protease [Halogranum tailed virus 1]
MSVQNIATVNVLEFERREAHLSEGEQDEPPYTIHGVALGSGDVTHGSSGIKKLWPGEELKKAAETLQGKNLVVDHNNSASGVVGRVTKAGYKEDVGVIYEAELFDEELAEKVKDGLLEVSIRGYHIDVDEMEENEDGVKVVEGIEFDNLSIVPKGASPSNSLEMGEHAELSVEELAAFTDGLEELQELEPSDFVQWDDMHGVIFKIEGDTAMVEVMEEIDGKWRAIGEQTEVSVDDLEMWDLDESNIGEPKEADSEDEESDEEESSTEENMSPENFMFQSEDAAIEKSRQLGLEGEVHTMEVEGVTYYMPGATHEQFLAAYMESGELSALPEELNRHLLDRQHPMKDNRDLNGENPDGESSEEMPEDEDEVPSPPEWEDGMIVQWQVEPQLFGKIVHVDGKRQIVMVEIHEMKNGELVPTGFTISAGFSDIQKFRKGAVQSGHMKDEEKEEEMAETYDDYPEAAKENAQMALDAREQTGNPNDCGTDVGWQRANQLASGESLSRDTIERMAQFNRHRQNSDMSDDEGKRDCGWMMWKAWGGDEGVDWAIRKSESFEENAASELEGSVHSPEYSGTHDREWNSPDLEDFTDESWEDLSDDEKSSIGGHFIYSMSGFPAENFSDMKLPVVEPDGTLSLNAVRNAKARLSQTDGPSEDQRDRIESMLDSMLEEEEATGSDDPQFVGVSVLTSDDFRRGYKSGESEMDSKNTKVINMTELSDELQARLEELEAPVAVEETDLEELQAKAEKYDDISEDISELRERTEVLDEVDRDLVDELADADEPMVIESSRYDSLSDEAEQVKKVYASNLAEELGAFDAEELMEKFSIEELRSKHEEHIGDLEEELSPDPKGADADEEELESPDVDEEELEREEEVKAKQDELRQKIFGK